MAVVVREKDFIDFSIAVRSGRDYAGTTVYLYSDLDFTNYTERFEPVGYYNDQYDNCPFRGTFDGQGHTIANLKVSTSSNVAGLFGVTEGMTVRNLVVDASCSLGSAYNSARASYVGSIVGTCHASKKGCVIENIVSMASVSFTGYVGDSGLYLGGITGRLLSADSSATVMMKNNVNYGGVTFAGMSESWEYIGGLAGECSGTRSDRGCYIDNCINYGTVTCGHTPRSNPVIGGIVGRGRNAGIENCVSAGGLRAERANREIGGIVGTNSPGELGTRITHSYWTEDVGVSNAYGPEASDLSTADTSLIEHFSSAVANELNSYANKDPSRKKWLTLHPNGGTMCGTNRDMYVTLQNRLTEPVKEGYTFSAWCKDKKLRKKFNFTTDDITKITDLYASFTPNSYAVTFNPAGGLVKTATRMDTVYGKKYGKLPTAERDGYTFGGWFTGAYGTLDRVVSDTAMTTAGDHMLYAYYTQNGYTVTFDPMGGNTPVRSKNVVYGQQYGELPEATRTGYSFDGWFTGKDGAGDRISPSTVVSTSGNTKLYASWRIGNYTVTFDLGNGTKIERMFQYGDSIVYPNVSDRGGHRFEGWDPSIKTMPDHNFTTNLKWRGGPAQKNDAAVTAVNIIGGIVGVAFAVLVFAMLFIVTRGLREQVKGGAKELEPNQVFFFYDEDEEPGSNHCASSDADSEVIINHGIPSDTRSRRNSGSIHEARPRRNSYSWREARSRYDGSEDTLCDTDMLSGENSSINDYECLYPQNYNPPKMEEALAKAGLNEEDVRTVAKACSRLGKRAEESGRLFGGFTREDAEAVALFSFDFGPGKHEMNPYRVVNKALTEPSEESVERTSGLMHVMMSALRKLPRTAKKTLYRGLNDAVDRRTYREGGVVVWPGFSSASPNINAVKSLIAKGGRGKRESSGTLFIIEDGWGYDLQPYSLVPGDEEVILEPNRLFRVQGVIGSETLIIKLQMIDTPPILPQLFGPGTM